VLILTVGDSASNNISVVSCHHIRENSYLEELREICILSVFSSLLDVMML
jgi:hypothetical protein